MATINESTITLFLARMSLDLQEQNLYLGNEGKYLEGVTNMPLPKRAILSNCVAADIRQAALNEQPGRISTRFQFAFVNYYQAMSDVGDEIARFVRHEISSRLDKK